MYVAAQRYAESGTQSSRLVPGEEKPWKVEVVNIAGEDGLAGRMTVFLRTLGYDVVDYNSRQVAGYERTTIIDRTGNTAGARDIAEALGLGEDRIKTEMDRTLYVDVTVILGYDYKTIRSLKHLERN